MYIILIAHTFKLKNYMNYLTLQNISLPPYVNTALICEYFQSHKKKHFELLGIYLSFSIIYCVYDILQKAFYGRLFIKFIKIRTIPVITKHNKNI